MFGRSAQTGRKGFNTGNKHTEETKKRISETLKKSMTLEVRQKMSKSRTGSKNYMYGKRGKDTPNFGRKHSEETKQKMREAYLKRKQKQNENTTA